MKLRRLSIAIAFLVIGTGGNFAYDAYRAHELQKRLETLPTGTSCRFCPAGKAEHLVRMKEINTKRSASEAEADNDAD